MNVGIIGLGVGEKHLETFLSHDDVHQITICDFDEKKLNETHLKYPNLFKCKDSNKLLTDPSIDLVSICSYDHFHADQIIMALKNKKHVFVEKPICLSEDELSRIRTAFSNSIDLNLSSNFILRKEPRFIELMNKIRDGELGDIYYAEGSYDYGRFPKIINGWRGQIENYSVMHGGGIHLLDLLMWTCNLKVKNSFGLSSKNQSLGLPFSGPEFSTSLIEMDHGAIIKLTANFASNTPHFHQIKIYGTKGTFVHDCNSAKYFFGQEPDVIQIDLKGEFPSTQRGDLLLDFLNSIIYGSSFDLNAEKVFEVMASSVTIEKNLRIVDAISK
ncbi:MAG: Gfo/Idh/MocA family oxidoreductase [Gammaproteobacteria bacterium]